MTNWLTLDEAAQYLKMGKSTLYDLARKGNMEGFYAAISRAKGPMWLAKPIDSLKGVEDISAAHSRELTQLSISLGPFGFEGDDHTRVLAWKFWRFGLRPFQES